MANLKFKYSGGEGEVTTDAFGGIKEVRLNDQPLEMQKEGGQVKWVSADGTELLMKRKMVFFPQLQIGDELIDLVQLKSWEYFFVLLPIAIVIISLGGALPAVASVVGVGLMVGVFSNPQMSTIMKIAASVGYTVGVFVLILIITALIFGTLGA